MIGVETEGVEVGVVALVLLLVLLLIWLAFAVEGVGAQSDSLSSSSLTLMALLMRITNQSNNALYNVFASASRECLGSNRVRNQKSKYNEKSKQGTTKQSKYNHEIHGKEIILAIKYQHIYPSMI